MEAPPIIQPLRRRWAWWTVGPLLFGVATMAILFFFNPTHYSFYPRCLLYQFTGILCPGCGSLRALHLLSHGHVLEALRSNVLLVISLPFAAWFAVRWLACWRSGAPLPPIKFNARWVITMIFVVVVFTILRNIHRAPFLWLAPA